MSEPLPLPEGFSAGHWSDPEAETGCTVVIAPPDSVGAAEVLGGGPATREIEVLGAGSHPREATAVALSGGSAYGLAAADGAMRWLEEHGRGYATPVGLVPIVPAASIYDLAAGRPGDRPDAAAGYAACEAARREVPQRGRVGAGSGAAAGKILGRERATLTGLGYAAARTESDETVAALAVANPVGDVIGTGGEVLAGPRGEDGGLLRTSALIGEIGDAFDWRGAGGQNTTLVCVCTDASLTRAGADVVARMTTAGIARAVDPVFTPHDGDVAFCLASGREEPAFAGPIVIGTLAATLAAEAIRDAAG